MEKRQGSITIGLSEPTKPGAGKSEAESNPISDVRELRHGQAELEAPTVRKPPPLDAIRRTRSLFVETEGDLLEPDSEALTPSISKTIIGAPIPAALRSDAPTPSAGPEGATPHPPRAPLHPLGPPRRDNTTLTSPVIPLESSHPPGAVSHVPGSLPRAPRPTVTLTESSRPSEFPPAAEGSAGSSPAPVGSQRSEMAALRQQLQRLEDKSQRSETERLWTVTAVTSLLSLGLGLAGGYLLGEGSSRAPSDGPAAPLNVRELSPDEQRELLARVGGQAATTPDRVVKDLQAELEKAKQELASSASRNAELERKLEKRSPKERSERSKSEASASGEAKLAVREAPQAAIATEARSEPGSTPASEPSSASPSPPRTEISPSPKGSAPNEPTSLSAGPSATTEPK